MLNLDRPGKLYPDGVFVFDEPVKVEYVYSNFQTCEIYAEGYMPACNKCESGMCVFVNPYPIKNSTGFALKQGALKEICD